MALLPGEIARLKVECGFNILNLGAEPYIGISQLWELVIVPNLTSGIVTTSSTGVSASAPPALATLTLGSATGFVAGARVVVDIDARQETVSIESVSGSTISALLGKDHSGVYGVTVEGPESIIREYLTRIRDIKDRMAKSFGTGALKKVDEVEFYELVKGQTVFGALGDQLMYWRDELCSALGIVNLWQRKRSGAQTLSVY